MRLLAFLALTLCFLDLASAAGRCHAILFQSEGSGPVIDGRFTQNLARMHQALRARGCSPENIRVLAGSGDDSDPMTFPFRPSRDVTNVRTRTAFPGSRVQQNSRANLETAINQLRGTAKAGDSVFIHIAGHSVGSGEFELRDSTMTTSEFSQKVAKMPPGVKTRVIHDVCWSAHMAESAMNLPNVCVLTSQNYESTSMFSNRNSYSRQLASAFRNRNNTLLEAHWQADRLDPEDNNAFSSLDLFIDRTVDIGEFARLERFLSGKRLDCDQTSRTVDVELRNIFNGVDNSYSDMNRFFRFAQGRTVGDILLEYARVTNPPETRTRRAEARRRFEAARRAGNHDEMHRIEMEMESGADVPAGAQAARVRQLRQYLGSLYILRFGTEAEKRQLRNLLDCYDTGSRF